MFPALPKKLAQFVSDGFFPTTFRSLKTLLKFLNSLILAQPFTAIYS